MKAIFIFFLLAIYNLCFGYFDVGFNYTIGKDDYIQNDINLVFAEKNWWLKLFAYSWENKNFTRFSSFGIKWGNERPNYTISFLGGYTPKNNGYENLSVGGDITFSLKPSKKRETKIAGPNYGFRQSSKSGVNQIDIGTQFILIAHRYDQTDIDLREISTSFFGGLNFFYTNLSFSYSFSSYDKNNIAISYAPPLQKIYGLNSIFPVFMSSNFNIKMEIISNQIIVPYLSYNKFKTKSNKTVNIYAIGSYIDISMVGIDFRFETYKDLVEKIQRYLSASIYLRF